MSLAAPGVHQTRQPVYRQPSNNRTRDFRRAAKSQVLSFILPIIMTSAPARTTGLAPMSESHDTQKSQIWRRSRRHDPAPDGGAMDADRHRADPRASPQKGGCAFRAG